MEIAFATYELRDICESSNIARDKYGQEISLALVHRLADLMAVDTVADLFVGKPRQMMFNNLPHYSIDLKCNFKIVFCANHVENPEFSDSQVDWERVKRIKIVSILNEQYE